jgi:hypothetical protein
MEQLKKVLFGLLLVVVCILLIRVSPGLANHDEDDDDTPGMIGGVPDYMGSTQRSIDFLNEGDRLFEQCRKTGKGSKACMAFEAHKKKMREIGRMQEDYTAFGNTLNLENEIGNDVRRGELERRYRGDLRGYKNELSLWREDLKAAERAGDRKAQAEAQRQISFYESKVKEYSK